MSAPAEAPKPRRKKTAPEPPPSPVPTPTHLASTEARIEHIANEMRELRFVRGKTIRELAEAWGVKREWVKKLSAKASKRVRAEVGGSVTGRRDVLVALDKVIKDGITEGDRKAVVAALKLKADLLGIAPPKRTELTGRDGGPVQVSGPVIMIPPESDD